MKEFSFGRSADRADGPPLTADGGLKSMNGESDILINAVAP